MKPFFYNPFTCHDKESVLNIKLWYRKKVQYFYSLLFYCSPTKHVLSVEWLQKSFHTMNMNVDINNLHR